MAADEQASTLKAISAMMEKMEETSKAQVTAMERLNETATNLLKAVSKLFETLSVLSHSHRSRLTHYQRQKRTVSMNLSGR